MNLKDEHFLNLHQQDGKKGLEAIYNQYYGHLCKQVNRILQNPTLSEDIVQDVFVKLWQKKDILITSSLSAYLTKAAINEALSYLRSQKGKSTATVEESSVFAADSANDLEYKDLKSEVRKAINQLPPRCKVVFILSRYEKMSYKEIAAYLNISTKTVENQISKALQRLRAQLKEHLE